MITRKRGKIQSDAMSSPSYECEGAVSQLSSPESDSNDWGLDDLLSSDFNWAMDDDALATFPDAGLQDLGLSAEKTDVSAVTLSNSRASTRRQKLQDLSGNINKNALAARLNRLKKKEYLTGLEQSVGSLTSENQLLKQENISLTKRVEELENETRYLRAVLANESTLAQLLSRLSGVNGMKLSTSLFQKSNENDHDYAMPRKKVKVEDKAAAGGVCLHVDTGHVSVEFCTRCAESASASIKM
ncbi:CREB/ATF bZIP transcription factor [Trichomycterus rosablanca]|uniref:CREB/ATF bZIP transcription factor n=1 Tax=Trichomycterus rosablanca TaxID=2290929 RepID=UPI002F35487E